MGQHNRPRPAKNKGSHHRNGPKGQLGGRSRTGSARGPALQGARHGARGPSSESLVIGRNPVREVLTHCPERVREIHVVQKAADRTGRASSDADLFELAHTLDVPFHEKSFDALTSMAGTESHQGWILLMAPRPKVELKEFLDALESQEESIILVLDAIQDPQNLGSIIRAAECFGVEAVIWSRNRGAALTPSAAKASVGASELVTLIEVGNINDALEKCRARGWWILGAMVSDDAVHFDRYEGPMKVVLVLGGEGEGLHRLTERSLDQRIMIPLRGKLDSLNVGQAAAVLLAGLAQRIDTAQRD